MPRLQQTASTGRRMMFKLDELLSELVRLETLNTELLEALKDIANTELISDELITIAKDAIAKAEGKT